MTSLARPAVTGAAARLRAAFDQIGLPAWFVAIDLLWIADPNVLGVDARHYQRAAGAWLSGSDPWLVTELGTRFAAGPHTLLLYAPTSILPLTASTWLWMAIGVLAAGLLVRRLGLRWWWFLFPPLFHATWNGNPQNLALALLVAGGPVAASIASMIKLYALVPLLGRWRDLLVALIVLAVTLPLLPWQHYIEHGFGVSQHLHTAWNGSAWRVPMLMPIVAVALWVLRRDGGPWFAVPALWPATQFYYVAMALPAIRGRRWIAAALATPAVLCAPLVVLVLASQVVLRARRWGLGTGGTTGAAPVLAADEGTVVESRVSPRVDV